VTDHIDDRIEGLFFMGEALVDVERIKLVGTLRRGLGREEHGDFSDSAVFEDIAWNMPGLMETRAVHGTMNDLHITIMPDTSPESEAAAVWHTYKQPDG